MAQFTKNETYEATVAGYHAASGVVPQFVVVITTRRVSDGKTVSGKRFVCDLTANKITDENGVIVAATIPNALLTAKASFEAQLNTLLTNAVTNGKVDL